MKDFYEVVAQIEERNRRQQQEFMNAMQPFFNLILQKKMKEEEIADTEDRQRQKNIEYGKHLAGYLNTGQLADDAPAELQQAIFSRTMGKRDQSEEVENKLKVVGEEYFNQYKELTGNGVDPWVALGIVGERTNKKDLREKIGTQLGSEYGAMFDQKIKSGMSPFDAYGDVFAQAGKRDKQVVSSGGGGGGGAVSPEEKRATLAQQKAMQKEVDDARSERRKIVNGVPYSYNYGTGDQRTGNITVSAGNIKGGVGGENIASKATFNNVAYFYNGKNYYTLKKGKWEIMGKEPPYIAQALRAARAQYLTANHKVEMAEARQRKYGSAASGSPLWTFEE